ncbi:hypothetical protein [Rothia amarae]|uniref:hypothetical protein n=1 Tax=Rothia amarae TaxID=169480 RepID=UPI0031E280BB
MIKEVWNNFWGSIINFFCTFPNQLFSANSDTALMAWTLLATIAIPVALFLFSKKNENSFKELQLTQLSVLHEIKDISKAASRTVDQAAHQSFVEGLSAELDLETTRKYLLLVDKWENSPLKDLALQKIRSQLSIPLPGNPDSLEKTEELDYLAVLHYIDSFPQRVQNNYENSIYEIGNFLEAVQNDLSISEYQKIAQSLFAVNIPNTWEARRGVKNFLHQFPNMVEYVLQYTLNWPVKKNSQTIITVVDSLYRMVHRGIPKDKEIVTTALTQPLADFINAQSYRNIFDLGLSSIFETTRIATEIIYLAGESAEIHDGSNSIDHLKMRMIEGIPNLFRDINLAEIDNYPGDLTDLREAWVEGVYRLSADFPDTWNDNWMRIQPIDRVIRNL